MAFQDKFELNNHNLSWPANCSILRQGSSHQRIDDMNGKIEKWLIIMEG